MGVRPYEQKKSQWMDAKQDKSARCQPGCVASKFKDEKKIQRGKACYTDVREVEPENMSFQGESHPVSRVQPGPDDHGDQQQPQA